MSPWIKYTLFQIPGWFVAGAVLSVLAHWDFIPNWLAIAGFVGWLLKDLLLYPFFRRAYEPGVTGSARLIGSRGIAEGDLAPAGFVRVHGELWRAVASPADVVVRSGTEVEIVRTERMELFVRALGTGAGE